MASFTDAIPQFNPYIQQLPVEEMVAVGVQRQQQYEQGIQRIQSEIDRVAGLDIVRDVDRQYLQSKLNDLGSKLRTVAAGDFSNFQLVNSVAGMAGKVAKDNNVINAVQSTAQRRKLLERMQTDVEKGNYNPANQYVFNESDNKWFNDPTVGAKYTGSYKTPHDVWGRIKDIAKEVGIDEKTAQQLFETDSLGRTKFDSSGNPVWNNIMVEKTFKGKDASKILNAFQAGLNPSDYEQLGIEGRYKYRSVTPEALKESIILSTEKNVKINNGKIEMLKLSLSEQVGKGDGDEELITSIRNQIEFFENQNKTFTNSRDNSLSVADSNPEALKASLFTDNYLATMSQALSSKDVSEKYSVSPMFEVSMKINEFKQRQEQWLADYNLRLRADSRAQGEYDEKMRKLQEQATYFQGGGVDLPIETDAVSIRAMVEGGYDELVTNYNQTSIKIALEVLRKANPGDSDEELMRKLSDVSASQGKTLNPSSGEIQTTAQTIASSMIEMYRKDPNSVDGPVRGLLFQQGELLKSISAQESIMSTAKTNADNQAILQGIDLKNYNKIIEKAQPILVNLPNGKPVQLSKQDVIDFVNSEPQRWNFFGSLTIDKEQAKRAQSAKERLTNKYGYDFNEIKNTIYPPYQSRREGGLGGTVNPMIQQLGEDINASASNEYNKILAEEYKKIGAIPIGKSVTVSQGDDKPQDYKNKFINVINKFETINPNLYNKLSSSILSGDFGANIEIQPGATLSSPTTFSLAITGKDGVPQKVPIEAGDYKSLTGYNPPMNPGIKNAYDLLTAKGTTNLSDKKDPSTAYFKSDDFKLFSSNDYFIMGDLEQDLSNPNIVFPKIYVFDKKSGNLVKPLSINTPLPKQINGQINPNLENFASAITAELITQTTKFPIN
jgi:hypothetical protein